MKSVVILALFVMSLVCSVALSACSDEVGADYYENDSHRGYPGPATTTPGREG